MAPTTTPRTQNSSLPPLAYHIKSTQPNHINSLLTLTCHPNLIVASHRITPLRVGHGRAGGREGRGHLGPNVIRKGLRRAGHLVQLHQNRQHQR
ncbi:hypothetical protein E2C01_084892 [Portunus trituberculatus]|uniref:Uncharacterized protein n=1 Tax=Portunus trituberculatus TaxID=210409 RepID=A0A5B7JAH3_PORTR|nr:hypothetical protein [Portunus trituberculatus]